MKTARWLLACGLLAAGAAQAQVYKCTDSSGHVVFSDRGCTNSQSGGVVQKRTTERQRMQADWDAYVANNEKLMRREREQEQEAAKAAFYAEEHARQAAAANNAHSEYTSKQQKQRDSVRSRFDPPKTLAERGLPSRPAPPPNTPSQIVSCDGGGCMDTNGNRLNNAGGGNFTSTDGKFCQRINPNQVICN